VKPGTGDSVTKVAGVSEGRGFTCAALGASGEVRLVTRTVRRALIGGGRVEDAVTDLPVEAPHVISALAFGGGDRLYLGTEGGALLDVSLVGCVRRVLDRTQGAGLPRVESARSGVHELVDPEGCRTPLGPPVAPGTPSPSRARGLGADTAAVLAAARSG